MTTHGAASAAILAISLAVASEGRTAEPATDLSAQMEQLRSENALMRQELRELRDEVRSARDEAEAAQQRAQRAESVATAPRSAEGGIALGGAQLRLIDLSLDTLIGAGWSSADDDDLEFLQGGGHDPHQRGFNLQALELSLRGAVDPYLTGEAHLVYFIDAEGESRFEIEEAFATSQMLPFHLEEHGFQIEAGSFFTEYGRINPQHTHAWDWLDTPIVNSRLFGEDGLRGPGMRIGWLTPLPWFSELHLGVQNASGETAYSFHANEEAFEEAAIGGRPYANRGTRNAGDLLYLLRWVNAWDLNDEWSAQLGVSGLLGPNATGPAGRTRIAGADLVVKWNPLSAQRGYPGFVWQSEFSHRWYRADDYQGCPGLEDGEDCVAPAFLGSDELRDWGFYSQMLFGIARGWQAGLRFEYAGGSGDNVRYDEDAGIFVSESRQDDPRRDDRYRFSPLLVYRLSEFSRLRLQYNYDLVNALGHDDAHTVWLGLEFMLGSHAAHGY